MCSCLKGNETAEHYIFSCERYIEQRVRLFRNTREFHPLNINMLLNGKDSLSDSDNAKLFRHVQNYIHATVDLPGSVINIIDSIRPYIDTWVIYKVISYICSLSFQV